MAIDKNSKKINDIITEKRRAKAYMHSGSSSTPLYIHRNLALRNFWDTLISDNDFLVVVRCRKIYVNYLGQRLFCLMSGNADNDSVKFYISRRFATTDRRSARVTQVLNKSYAELADKLNENPTDYALWKRNLKKIKAMAETYSVNLKVDQEETLLYSFMSKYRDWNGDIVLLLDSFNLRDSGIKTADLRKFDALGICIYNGKYRVTAVKVKVDDFNLKSRNRSVPSFVDACAITESRHKSRVVWSANSLLDYRRRLNIIKKMPIIEEISDDEPILYSIMWYVSSDKMRALAQAEIDRAIKIKQTGNFANIPVELHYNIIDISDSIGWSGESLSKNLLKI